MKPLKWYCKELECTNYQRVNRATTHPYRCKVCKVYGSDALQTYTHPEGRNSSLLNRDKCIHYNTLKLLCKMEKL